MPAIKPTRGILLNRTHPLARGLVGLWLFNEGSGSEVFDLSGNGKTGIFDGTVTWTPAKFGSGLQPDGFAGHIQWLDDTQFRTLSTGSVLLWVYPISDSKIVWYFSEGTPPFFNSQNYHRLGVVSGSWQWLAEVDNVPVIDIISDSAATLYAWSQIVLTQDGMTSKMFVNGILQADTDSGEFFSDSITDGCIVMGDSAWGVVYEFDGKYDHWALWNRALSAFEICSIYQEPFCMVERPALRHFSIPVTVVAARSRRHVGFKPIEGMNRLRGLGSNALY